MCTTMHYLAVACLMLGQVHSISLDVTDATSIRSAASTVAYGMLQFYNGNLTGQTPGLLPQPYYWYEAGAMFGNMVEYYYYTGDPTYNNVVAQAMEFQAGADGTFMPANQTKDEGNDDQVLWAFAAMSAAEYDFPPPSSGYPSWVAMAQGVFNLQAGRWDDATCNGGLRWQVFPFNQGYNYKNVVANGGFFQLAARLARYTGNVTYLQWAEKEWDWLSNPSLGIIHNASTAWKVYDGDQIAENGSCVDTNYAQYSYNYGMLLGGLAVMYNHTQDDKWLTPLYGILNGTFEVFFPKNKIIVEVGCEPFPVGCDSDSLTFKSFTMRFLALTAQLVNATAPLIWPYMEASAVGAAGQCDGGSSGVTCGYHWTQTTWDGSTGVGQQMSALAAIQGNMLHVANLKAPLTLVTGGTSKSNPNAGTSNTSSEGNYFATAAIQTRDRAGAGVLTAFLVIVTLAAGYWLI